MIVAHLVEKFPTFCETKRFITLFKRASHCIVNQTHPPQGFWPCCFRIHFWFYCTSEFSTKKLCTHFCTSLSHHRAPRTPFFLIWVGHQYFVRSSNRGDTHFALFTTYWHFLPLWHKFFGMHDLSKAFIYVFCPQRERQSLTLIHNNEQICSFAVS